MALGFLDGFVDPRFSVNRRISSSYSFAHLGFVGCQKAADHPSQQPATDIVGGIVTIEEAHQPQHGRVK
jgi:hypothetical protein